jgi:Ca2+-binding RTX toxin-like protein
MKIRLLRITILLLFLASVFIYKNGFKLLSNSSTVRAVGDLRVDWGVPHEGDPLFKILNMAPGQNEAKEVHIINDASTTRPVGVRGIKTEEVGGLSEKLNIAISKNGTNLYTDTLAKFFDESSGPDGIELFNANPGTDSKLVFTVSFDPSADNNYQNTKVIFDLHIGIAVTIPKECLNIKFSGDPIFGTEGSDNLRGTNGNDLIYGFEGDDTIESSNGDDCVVGGAGNDKINNSNGNDVIYGNESDDTLNGSNGNDQIFGGDGADKINGSNGDDVIYGENGDDTIYAGNGNDLVYGGSGDDYIDGGNGDDKLFSDEGDDTLFGRNGNDYIEGGPGDDKMYGVNGNDNLIGGSGKDSADGGLDRDICDAELKKSCER